MYTDYLDGTKTGISAASTGTTTGTALDVSQRSLIGLVFTAASISAGNGVFSVDGSNDGTNYVTGLAFTDATATAATTYVTSKTLSSNTSAGVYLAAYPYRYIRIKVVGTTDGAYTATMMEKDGA